MRMFVPLWVVNATSLPVAALVVPVQPPRQSSEHEGQAGDNLLDAAESIRLKVLETDAGDGAPAAGSRSRRWHSSTCLIGACAQKHPEYDWRQDLESLCRCTATVLKAERYTMRVNVASFDIDRSYHPCCGFGRYGSSGLVLKRDPLSVLQWHATRSAACASGQCVHGGLPNAADGCIQAQWRPSELWPAAEGRLINAGRLVIYAGCFCCLLD